MTLRTLRDLYNEHQGKVSDKWSLYLSEYDKILAEYRDKPLSLLEIGIQNGGSLEILAKYFAAGTSLVGCDINPDCGKLVYGDPRISIVIGDVTKEETLSKILNHTSRFNIIIDDGSHRSSDIVKTFAAYFPHLAENGLFIVEDLHCSYWQEFEGALFAPFSSMQFFKRLSDIINHEHWGVDRAPADLLSGFSERYECSFDDAMLRSIYSIEFVNSMCIIRKALSYNNQLGIQFIAGKEASVLLRHEHNLKKIVAFDQSNNPWTARHIPIDEEIMQLTSALAERDEHIASKNTVIAERDDQISDLSHATAERDVHIANLSHAAAERDVHIANLNHAAAERDVHIANLNHAAVERDVHIANLSQVAAERDAHIVILTQTVDLIMNSKSWRMTQPLRYLGLQLRRGLKLSQLAVRLLSYYRGNRLLPIQKIYRSYMSGGIPGIRAGMQRAAKRVDSQERSEESTKSISNEAEDNAFQAWIIAQEHLESSDLALLLKNVSALKYRPTFSIIVPVYNTQEDLLIAFIESVLAQVYPNFELCIVDDASTKLHVRRVIEYYGAEDKRIKVRCRDTNGHISAATNTALSMATGDFICLMDHDDLISPNALYEFACLLNEDPDLDFIYSDEDKITEDGTRRYEPFFKPDWSPEYLEACMYTAHFACYRTTIINAIGGFRETCNGAQDYDFVLRFTEHAKKVAHVPKLLYHWRAIQGSTAKSMDCKDYVIDAAIRALEDHVRRTGMLSFVRDDKYAGCFEIRRAIVGNPRVTIIIPSAGRSCSVRGQDVDLLVNCIQSIMMKSTYRNLEIIVVDNNDLSIETRSALSDYPIVFTHYESTSFNVAAKMNQGAQLATGEYLLFLNDDIEVISIDWIEAMLSIGQSPHVGVVGAKLHFEDGTLQHVGVAFCDGLPDHIRRGFGENDPGYFFSSVGQRNYMAVTGACMLVRKREFYAVGGFDEQFSVNYNDIDLCLKIYSQGKRVVFAAQAHLYHFESQNRVRTVASNEIELFASRWRNLTLHDPYYSNYFDARPLEFRLAIPK